LKRNLGKADEVFDIPAINFFTSGNDYFGSAGNSFRYRVSHSGDFIEAQVWRSDICFEKAEISAEKTDFPLTPDGLTQCVEWLFGEYEQGPGK